MNKVLPNLDWLSPKNEIRSVTVTSFLKLSKKWNFRQPDPLLNCITQIRFLIDWFLAKVTLIFSNRQKKVFVEFSLEKLWTEKQLNGLMWCKIPNIASLYVFSTYFTKIDKPQQKIIRFEYNEILYRASANTDQMDALYQICTWISQFANSPYFDVCSLCILCNIWNIFCRE